MSSNSNGDSHKSSSKLLIKKDEENSRLKNELEQKPKKGHFKRDFKGLWSTRMTGFLDKTVETKEVGNNSNPPNREFEVGVQKHNKLVESNEKFGFLSKVFKSKTGGIQTTYSRESSNNCEETMTLKSTNNSNKGIIFKTNGVLTQIGSLMSDCSGPVRKSKIDFLIKKKYL